MSGNWQRLNLKQTYQIMIAYKSQNGEVEQIRDGHFKVTIFTELGYCSFEMRHAVLDDAIAEIEG